MINFMLIAIILAFLILIALLRIVLGPTLPDRVVGMDTVNTLAVSLLIVLSVVFNQVIFIDIAIVYAALSFVGTIYFSKCLEAGK